MNYDKDLKECILMDFPETSDDVHALNYFLHYIPNIFIYNGYSKTMN